MNKKIAVYAGTFDPFTNGHLDIVLKTSMVFDKTIILFANNNSKKRMINLEEMMDALRKELERLWYYDDKIMVDYTSGFVADYCNDHHADYIIRGLRNNMDFMYEEEIAKINKELNPHIETVYFRAQNEIISSSMVKTLLENGKDTSKYVPKHIQELMTAWKEVTK